ncbi:MAG: hypothetical protein HRT57_15990 [Crocinitomicaceae bacterium]|nr:hypothetical protein [Crocinitomicaceae bacterium]
MIEQVKSSITKAFERFNQKDGIAMKDIRIKIVKNNGALEYTLMNKIDVVRPTSLTEMIGAMNSVLAKSTLHSSMEKLIKENGLDERMANLRLYPLGDNSPSSYLYNQGQPLKQIDISTLIN